MRTADLSRERLSQVPVRAGAAGGVLPADAHGHAPGVARHRARPRAQSGAHLCAYGLYAPLSADLLRSHGIDTILGPEFEADLTALASRLAARTTLEAGTCSGRSPASINLPQPVHPSRSPASATSGHRAPCVSSPRIERDLPALDKYAALQMPDGTRRVVGYTEASRGCKHLCRHCPIVPVYGGQFRVVAGRRHAGRHRHAGRAGRAAHHVRRSGLLQRPAHARRLVERWRASSPAQLRRHDQGRALLRHAADLPLLRDTGCLFVISAVEAVDDAILERLDKGHTRARRRRAVARCARSAAAGADLRCLHARGRRWRAIWICSK